MELILGGSALFVAIAALWLASHAMRKSDGETAELIRVHITRMKTEIVESNKTVAEAQRKVEALEKAIKKLKEMRDEDMNRMRNYLEKLSSKSRSADRPSNPEPARQPHLE